MINQVKIQRDQMQQLSYLVQKFGYNQRAMVLEVSQQMNQQNELLEKAIEKQFIMDKRLDQMESKMKEKDYYKYDETMKKVKQKKSKEQTEQLLRDFKMMKAKQGETDNSNATLDDFDEDDLSIDSETEVDKELKKYINKLHIEVEVKPDPIRDFYLPLKSITDKEDKRYIRKCKSASQEFVALISNDNDLWNLKRTINKCGIYYLKSKDSHFASFKIETTIDQSVDFVYEYIRVNGSNIDKRLIWAYPNYDQVKVVKEYKMNVFLLKGQMKKQWPLNGREALTCVQSIPIGNSSYYVISRSAINKSIPESNKATRINIKQDSYFLRPEEGDPNKTQITYISQFDFKGEMPQHIIQECASLSQQQSLCKLQQYLQKIMREKELLKFKIVKNAFSFMKKQQQQ